MKKNRLVVAHDAGAAEMLSSWIRQNPSTTDVFLLEGPAVAIFKRKLPFRFPIHDRSILQEIEKFDMVLTGTGEGSDLDKKAISAARRAAIPVCSFVDHWVNYRSRFRVNGRLVLPNEIWVGDSYAYRLAKKAFPRSKIRLVENPYLKEILKSIKHKTERRRKPSKVRVLYVAEPTTVTAKIVTGNANAFGYTEFEALRSCLLHLAPMSSKLEGVRIRMHPSEKGRKYDAVFTPFKKVLPIEPIRSCDLSDDVAWSDWIIGCDSMAMAVGVLAKRKVFSCIPKHGKKLSLPFPQIKKLFQEN